jgi:hypothetical protein
MDLYSHTAEMTSCSDRAKCGSVESMLVCDYFKTISIDQDERSVGTGLTFHVGYAEEGCLTPQC